MSQMRALLFPICLLTALGYAALPVAAQVQLPGVGLPDLRPTTGQVLETLNETAERLDERTARAARDLLRERNRAISRYLSQNSRRVEPDQSGNPARRGELLLLDLDAAGSAKLVASGFLMLGQEQIAGLGFAVTRLGVPDGLDLAAAEKLVSRLVPQASVAPDNIHFQSGDLAAPALTGGPQASSAGAPSLAAPTRIPIGMIDGAPASRLGDFTMRGFADGAPTPSHHGSAIASLLMKQGVQRIFVADVYGTDKAGGNALAIARGLGWLVESGSKVVTISLVGPRNAIVERAIAAAQRKGTIVVVAVGNDGPAAPPAYPASYDGVVAITAVDGRKRALIEAGHATHLDYAAPGADLTAHNARGKRVRVRGTSFATPLAAARIAVALKANSRWRSALDAEAEDLGEPGPDATFGRGLVCGTCGGNR